MNPTKQTLILFALFMTTGCEINLDEDLLKISIHESSDSEYEDYHEDKEYLEPTTEDLPEFEECLELEDEHLVEECIDELYEEYNDEDFCDKEEQYEEFEDDLEYEDEDSEFLFEFDECLELEDEHLVEECIDELYERYEKNEEDTIQEENDVEEDDVEEDPVEEENTGEEGDLIVEL